MLIVYIHTHVHKHTYTMCHILTPTVHVFPVIITSNRHSKIRHESLVFSLLLLFVPFDTTQRLSLHRITYQRGHDFEEEY